MASQETPTALPSPLVPVVSDWPTHVLVLCIILPILATLAVAGRFIAKSKTRARLKLDDALIVAALVRTCSRRPGLVSVANHRPGDSLWPDSLWNFEYVMLATNTLQPLKAAFAIS